MPRSIWKGAITFGLITIPVRLYTATDEKTVKFNLLHEKDNGRIKYQRVCSVDGKEVPWDEIVRGHEYEKDHYVTFTDEELEAALGDIARAIDVHHFVPLDQIDPVYFQKSYYIAPEATGVKAYKLLMEALEKSGKVGIATVAIRDKQHLATLRAADGVFVMELMFWPDEVRPAEFEELGKEVDIRKAELDMALSIIDNLSQDFDPKEYHDKTREKVEAMIEKKVEGAEVVAPEGAEPAPVVDLMAALRASVEATKARKADREKDTG
jgi:DNA end-binding protein Ku